MSSVPRTHEAIERWHQGKVNIFEELAKLETELNFAEAERIEMAKQLRSEKEMHAVCQNERNKWEALAHQLAAALGHSWFNARVDHRGKLLDFLDKKKAALAAYEEATR